jgi:hemoglobin/transferrin/lactoferrin receptor protein
LSKHKYIFVALSFLGSVTLTYAQRDTANTVSLEEAVIYSGKFKEKRKNIAQQIEVITARKIARANAQNTGDLLINTGALFVQKSQQGGSSPVIRGFEASRVLLVVDGIRLNNAIYRAGHLQNVITVDQNLLERVEVLYGPTSTLYGSDALGGVIHMRTKQPIFSTTGKPIFKTNTVSRISSANQEKTIHLTQQIGGKKWGWLQALTFSDFGDLKMGSRYPKKYPDFGRRTQYIQTLWLQTMGLTRKVAIQTQRSSITSTEYPAFQLY